MNQTIFELQWPQTSVVYIKISWPNIKYTPIWVWSHGFLFHGPWSSHWCAYYDQKLTNLGCYSESTFSCCFSGTNFTNFLIEYKYECICLHFLPFRPQLVQVMSLTVFFFGFKSSFSFFNTELKSKSFCIKLLALHSLWLSFWTQEPLELQLIWFWLILQQNLLWTKVVSFSTLLLIFVMLKVWMYTYILL